MTLELWMTNLPAELQKLPLINLAIPGTHNSMTYGINSKSRPAPDADKSTRRLYYFFPWFVRRWAKTQSVSVLEQLQLGVRYFDLRIAQQNGKFFYAHALFAMNVFEPLNELRQFLDTHRGEVVVLDLQHFYGMNVALHQQLQAELIEHFGSRLYTTMDGGLTVCTLQRCAELQRQVLLIYRRCPISLPPQFWPSHTWPTPWPNVSSAKKLEEFLANSLLSRKPTHGYVSQCVLTPTGRYIALRVFSSLRRVAKSVDKKLEPWILNQEPGAFAPKQPPRVNVFLADFVNLKDGRFCNWVVSLNQKLCTPADNIIEGAFNDGLDENEIADV